MVVYANSDDLLSELELILNQQPEKHLRIGTGELADSLALDHLTSYSIPLVEFFAHQEKGILEFKTKSNCVENILSLDHQSKTVVSWSISPQTIQQREEHKTSTLNERLKAAEQCVQAGYPIAFHLDPLIFYLNWETDYSALIQEIFDGSHANFLNAEGLFKFSLLHNSTIALKRDPPGVCSSIVINP